MIRKLDQYSPSLFRTGNGTLSIKAGLEVILPRKLPTRLAYADVDTPVEMPTLTAGTDYAVYRTYDGRFLASANYTAPTGYTSDTVRLIGGFHYAPGSNAAARAGGDGTPQINPYSVWDLKFRPACADPRGMALIAGGFWADIYLANTSPDVNGSSKYGATIVDGSSPAKIPAAFGGNGTNSYGSLTWFEAGELAASVGKQLLNICEFSAAAYGVTEGASVGADPTVTGLDAPRTSKWGLMQAAGVMLLWGREYAKSSTTNNWQNNTGGRGQIYGGDDRAVLMGGSWGDGASAGSRCASWGHAPWVSDVSIGARFRSDHVCLP